MNFFIRLIKKIFGRNKVKTLAAPTVSKIKENDIIKNKDNDFRENLMYQADPEICVGNGYKIKKVCLEDMV